MAKMHLLLSHQLSKILKNKMGHPVVSLEVMCNVCYCIRYLNNKPLGMQTFLDRLLIDNYRIHQIVSFLCNMCLVLGVCMAPSINSLIVLLFGGLTDIAWTMYFSCIFSYFFTKYLFVFQNNLFTQDNFDEEVVLFRIRILNSFLSFITNVIEYGLIENIYELYYQRILSQGYFDDNIEILQMGPIKMYFSFTIMVIIVGIQLHISYSGYLVTGNVETYSKKSLKLILSMLLAAFIAGKSILSLHYFLC